MEFEKHAYNIYPEMAADEYAELKADIQRNGYDQARPIYIYKGGIIDGWNRYKACKELGVTPAIKSFQGTDQAALEYVLSSNKRRNLTSSQRAAIAVEADDIIKAIEEQVEKERRAKQAETQAETKRAVGELIPPQPNRDETKKEAAKARTKIAETFGTNSRYISDAKRLKEENPEAFEKIKAGEATITKVKKEIKKEQRRKEREKVLSEIITEENQYIIDIEPGWYKIGQQFLYFGSNTDQSFIDFLPPANFAFADPPYNAGVDEWDHNFKWEQDYLQNIADVVAVTPGGWNAFNFYRETEMNYIWEMCCWIANGMTHGKCGYANFIKVSIFGKRKPKISQDHFKITIKTSETEDTKHKGRKPYDFMIHLLSLFTETGGVVVDAFAGSGTTLLVSERMGRISYNAEMNKQYCIDIINRGIENKMKYERI